MDDYEKDEKRLLEGFRRLSKRSQFLVVAQVIAGAEMEENARKIALGGLAAVGPLHSNRNPAPVGAAMAKEATA